MNRQASNKIRDHLHAAVVAKEEATKAHHASKPVGSDLSQQRALHFVWKIEQCKLGEVCSWKEKR